MRHLPKIILAAALMSGFNLEARNPGPDPEPLPDLQPAPEATPTPTPAPADPQFPDFLP
jgi:hypothetical protein